MIKLENAIFPLKRSVPIPKKPLQLTQLKVREKKGTYISNTTVNTQEQQRFRDSHNFCGFEPQLACVRACVHARVFRLGSTFAKVLRCMSEIVYVEHRHEKHKYHWDRKNMDLGDFFRCQPLATISKLYLLPLCCSSGTTPTLQCPHLLVFFVRHFKTLSNIFLPRP